MLPHREAGAECKTHVGVPAVRQGLDEGPGAEGRAGASVAKWWPILNFCEVLAVREWEQQFTFDEEKPPDRFKFSVLSGPSKMGKTRYVQGALVANPIQALILDCADAVVRALQDNFVRGGNRVIVFDEAHAEKIIRCKKVS